MNITLVLHLVVLVIGTVFVIAKIIEGVERSAIADEITICSNDGNELHMSNMTAREQIGRLVDLVDASQFDVRDLRSHNKAMSDFLEARGYNSVNIQLRHASNKQEEVDGMFLLGVDAWSIAETTIQGQASDTSYFWVQAARLVLTDLINIERCNFETGLMFRIRRLVKGNIQYLYEHLKRYDAYSAELLNPDGPNAANSIRITLLVGLHEGVVDMKDDAKANNISPTHTI